MGIVLLFCGLPGSGKSSFCTKLEGILKSKFGAHDDQSWILSYDVISAGVSWDESSFQNIRREGLDQIRIALSLPKRPFILVDDVMYLRSMRRDVYKIVRDMRSHLITIWLNTPIDTCRERNALRSGIDRVSDESFERICITFQPPNSAFICDRNYIVIDSSIELQELELTSIVTKIEKMITESDPYKDTKNKHNDVSKAMSQEAVSIIKVLDEKLRKIVQIIMQEAKSISCISSLGGRISAVKMKILSFARQYVTRVTNDSIEELAHWLRDMQSEFVCEIYSEILIPFSESPEIIADIRRSIEEYISNDYSDICKY